MSSICKPSGTADFTLPTRFNHPLPDGTYEIQKCLSNGLSYRDSNGRQGSLSQCSQCLILKLMKFYVLTLWHTNFLVN
jgi:hypothetical protein